MATSANRITGLATGMDIDAIVESSLSSHKNKIDTTQQQKQTLEIQQELYRKVMSDCNDFYNKYLDITKDGSVLKNKNYTSVAFQSSNSGVASATANASVTSTDTYSVDVTQVATAASMKINLSDLKDNTAVEIEYAGKTISIDVSKCKNDKELAQTLNKELSGYGLTAQYSDFDRGVMIETKEVGSTIKDKDGNTIDNNFKVKLGKIVNDSFTSTLELGTSSNGTDLKAVITKTTGGVSKEIIVNGTEADINAGKVCMNSNGNSITIDGVTFNMNSAGKTTLTSTKDISSAKDTIVNFINDYNKLITSLNTLVNEKRDRNYQPLTEEQKKEMTDSQIEKWEAKVKTGQLSRDRNLTRIITSLKRATQDKVTGVNSYLEKIGITPSKDYSGNGNGTFTIDENKLTEALENDIDAVMNLLIGYPDNDKNMSDEEKYNAKGIFYRIKDIFAAETVSSSSALSKKAGLVNSSTFSNNDITKSISSYEKKISAMQKELAKKQQSLYSKWSKIETMMNKYNTQSGYLANFLGY
ncbi:MAG: flagellar filament capping protein FliD [Clostridiaceae bacterium]|nr:flagellar filament capping protein FliD [Clostridiaceae bacterium]